MNGKYRDFPFERQAVIFSFHIFFSPHPLMVVGVLFSPMVSWTVGRKKFVWAVSQKWCRKLILGRDVCSGCRCATSWCNLDLTFDLAVVTLSLKMLSGLYLGNRKV